MDQLHVFGLREMQRLQSFWLPEMEVLCVFGLQLLQENVSFFQLEHPPTTDSKLNTKVFGFDHNTKDNSICEETLNHLSDPTLNQQYLPSSPEKVKNDQKRHFVH